MIFTIIIHKVNRLLAMTLLLNWRFYRWDFRKPHVNYQIECISKKQQCFIAYIVKKWEAFKGMHHFRRCEICITKIMEMTKWHSNWFKFKTKLLNTEEYKGKTSSYIPLSMLFFRKWETDFNPKASIKITTVTK